MKRNLDSIHSGLGCFSGFMMLCMLLALLTGCGGKSSSYVGRPVDEDKRIAILDGGPHEGVWETSHVTVNYQYNRQAETMKLSGKASVKRGGMIDYFSLHIHFIDGQGKINQNLQLVTAGGRNQVHEFSFEKKMKLEMDTRSMVFSYKGATRGIGDGSGSVNEFWKTP